MTIIETHTLSAEQKEGIRNTWNNEYPEQLMFGTVNDFDAYLNALQQPLHLLALENEKILGWAFLFERDHEKWFAIIIDQSIQKRGVGTMLLNVLKDKEPLLNGWVTDHNTYKKKNGEIYNSPLQFYVKNGFNVLHDIRLETEKLSAVKILWTRKIL